MAVLPVRSFVVATCLLLLLRAAAALAAAEPADITLKVAGYDYVLHGDRIRVVDNGDVVLDVCVMPRFDDKPVALQPWTRAGDNHYEAALADGMGKAIVREQHGHLAYWVETPVKEFNRVVYLSDGAISGDSWRTFVSDEYERLWDKNVDAAIPLSSAYMQEQPDPKFENGGMVDPDEQPPHWIWNSHVQTWAFKGKDRWLGVSMPGPWPIGVTRLRMHKARFSLGFDVYRPSAARGRLPAIYFNPGLADGFDALDAHRELSDALGLTDLKRVDHPAWWSNPIFHEWDEWERQANAGTITANSTHVLKLIQDWVKTVQDKTGNKAWNIPFEQYCYPTYGEYSAAKNLGTNEEVRAALDAWRTEGIHVGQYYHPFLVNKRAPLYQQHPDIFCKPKDPRTRASWPLEVYDPGAEFALVDWTNPEGRKVMLDVVEYILSSAPGNRDFDILKSNNWHSPDPRYYDFRDPDWGIGDLMTFKVQQLIYERAKKVKPDCMVSKYNALDPFMQPTFDIIEICEDFTATTDFWWRRGTLVTRLLRNRLMWTSAWFVTRTKWNEYYTSISAWSIPETMAVTHTTHPYYPQWRPLHDVHYNRRRSGIQVYLNAPQQSSDVSHVLVTPDRFEAYRKKTEGPLAGWYGALALSRRCWVTYSDHEARVGATQAQIRWVPLPPRAKLGKVTCVARDGRETPCERESDPAGNRVRLYVQDAGGDDSDVLYYRITYDLTR
jgi:hypothetical protein